MKKENNQGSAVVEATLILPIFILFMLALYQMGRVKLAEACVYEAAAETAEYMAEYAYLDKGSSYLPLVVYGGYVDDRELLEKNISGGISGISFWGTTEDEEYINLKVNYTVGVEVPLLPFLKSEKSFVIKQRKYKGYIYDPENAEGNNDCYVYVAENESVYHMSRGCTYLRLSISSTWLENARNRGYRACELCGEGAKDAVYITDSGGAYHTNLACSGLKRTVHRIKLSETNGLGGCSRCVRE